MNKTLAILAVLLAVPCYGQATSELTPLETAKAAATVSDLANVKRLKDGDYVALLGYYAEGDGGGQMLLYDSGSSATVDGGFVFNGPGSVGRYLAVDTSCANALRWGVKPNDTAQAVAENNTTQLQAALNSSSRRTYLPGKVATTSYYLETGVTVPQYKILVGDGWDTRIRPRVATSSGDELVTVSSYAALEHLTLQGLSASGGTSAGNGVTITGGATSIDLNHVQSITWANGFNIENSYVISFRSCRAGSNTAAGIKLATDSCNAIAVLGGEYIANAIGVEIVATGSTLAIVGATIQGNTTAGIKRTANVISNGVSIRDSYFESNGVNHIKSDTGVFLGGEISGNFFGGTITGSPVDITRWDGLFVGANQFSGSYVGDAVTLASTCRNGTVLEQSSGQQTDGVHAVVTEAGKNARPGRKSFQFQPFAVGDTVTTGDGRVYYAVPAMINGSVITAVRADLLTASSSGAPNFDLTRIRSGTPVDILSTNLTVDQDETTSADATTPAVINTSNDDLQTGDLIRLDVDTAGTATNFPMITVEVTQ